MHYKDELKLTDKQKEEFAKLEVKDIYPEYYILKVDRFRNIVQSKLDEWMYSTGWNSYAGVSIQL